MRRNKRVRKDARFSSVTKGLSSVVIIIFVGAISLWRVDEAKNRTTIDIGKAEKELSHLEAECVRQTSRWDAMKTTANLDAHLKKYGMDMRVQNNKTQVINMDMDGNPRLGQYSVALAQKRASQFENVAQNFSTMERPLRKRKNVRR